MNLSSKTILSVVIVLFFLLALWFTFFSSPTKLKQPSQATQVQVTKVVEKQVEETIEAIGTAVAFESVTITANITEYVRNLHFEDGDLVKQGDLLVEMATKEEKSRLAEAKARLLQAKQQYDRIANLLKRNFSAQSEYDTQKAALDSAEAQVEQIQSQLEDRSIKAPFSGLLGFRQISVGTLLEPGDPVVTLDMIQPLKVDFTVPEKYLSKTKVGLPFEVTSVAYPEQIFTGKVVTISPRLNANSRSIVIRGMIDNKDQALKPGMLLNITLPISEKQVLIIPEEALLAKENQRYVFVVNPDNTVSKRDVAILKRHKDVIEVTGQLQKGEKVVSRGAFKLTDGQEVAITP